MIFQYNNYRLPNAAAVVSIPRPEVLRDDFGNVTKVVRTWLISGEILGTPAELPAALRALERAFNRDGGDAYLFYQDGTPSGHQLLSRNTLGGIKSSYVYYPEGNGVELVNGRKFQIELMGEFAPDVPIPDKQVQSFNESVTIQGDGGPRYVLRETRNTKPIRQMVSRSTPVRATQTGSATGYGSYPPAPPPIWPVPILQNPETAITRQSPQQTGRGGNSTLTEYTISWNYQFLSDGPLQGLPSKRTR